MGISESVWSLLSTVQVCIYMCIGNSVVCLRIDMQAYTSTYAGTRAHARMESNTRPAVARSPGCFSRFRSLDLADQPGRARAAGSQG